MPGAPSAHCLCSSLSLPDRFLALRLPDPATEASSAFYFVYSCPETTPVRTKMTMSSSKATVLAAASGQGISFARFPLPPSLPPSHLPLSVR
jgi:hypothetical protein